MWVTRHSKEKQILRQVEGEAVNWNARHSSSTVHGQSTVGQQWLVINSPQIQSERAAARDLYY